MRTRPSPLSSPGRSPLSARPAARARAVPGSLLAVLLVSATGWTQVTSRESVGTGGAEGNLRSILPSISADGRYVAFVSIATNLVPGDTNGCEDIFVRDRSSGTTERVSVDSGGVQGDAMSAGPSISADGRYVVFESLATNLVAGDTNAVRDIFVRDRLSGTTERVNVDSGGAQANGVSSWASISPDGRYVTFMSEGTNLVAGDTNATGDVFLRDRLSGTTQRVSLAAGGAQGNNFSGYGSISADGRYVSFASVATNLVAGDTNNSYDVFVRDLVSATTERVSVATGGAQANNGAVYPSISADGRSVVFFSGSTNLVAGDTNGVTDVFLHDLVSGATERVSVATGGAQGDSGSSGCSVSADGRYVAFESAATNLVAGDTNGVWDIFVRDRQSGTTERASVDSGGVQGNDGSGVYGVAISADGRFVAFDSGATNLVAGDANAATDVFVHDREATGSTSLCDPGVGGVIACPCSNPPSGPGRGCDNSSATGGAALAASGIAYLSMDSLVFTTSGEKPTATSILLQGNALASSGVVYGQGVRCVGGTFRSLFTKHAVAGGITAPDFGAGDPSVSARSAAKGDVIQSGQSRWYLVYYRDPIVLVGCAASSTFNATQTVAVDWIL
jgi:Tol biopolymer transport system component